MIFNLGEVEDLVGVTAKECMFRINRDVRFSADKSPYKATMSAVIARGGRKPVGRSYYVHIEPDDNSMLAGGLHSPSAEELNKVRAYIAQDSKKLKQILQRKDFVQSFGELKGESLKSAPQGYAKDHPDIALLRMKQFLATHSFTDAQVLVPDLTAQIVKGCNVLKPLLTYIESALDAQDFTG